MIQYTGERVIPKLMKPTNSLLLEHLARYQFSMEYMKGRVLDLGCGVGYGTHMIAKAKKKQITEAIGIDIDEKTIDYARKNYQHPLVSYQREVASNIELPSKLGNFDTIISFEALEHVKEEGIFMSNIYEMLNPGGTLVISTPFGEGRGIKVPSPFHVHQLTVEEFKELFHPYKEVHYFGQNGVLIEPLVGNRASYLPIGIAVCKK